MSDFYSALAPFYDDIFPDRQPMAVLIEDVIGGPGIVMDAGCATGSLSVELAARGSMVTGIDLDPELLDLARMKMEMVSADMELRLMDILDIGEEFGLECFDAVACIGNTLPHLPSLDAVTDFFEAAYSCLQPGGRLITQVLNYDHILAKESVTLPPIKTKDVSFHREYRADGGKVIFATTLKFKGGKDGFEHEVLHIPLTPKLLSKAFNKAGYEDIALYSDTKRKAFTEKANSIIAVGTKPDL